MFATENLNGADSFLIRQTWGKTTWIPSMMKAILAVLVKLIRSDIVDITTILVRVSIYLQSRYYDPVAKRFINADSVNYLGANGDFISLNWKPKSKPRPLKKHTPARDHRKPR